MRWRPFLPWLLALGVVLLFLAIQGRYVLRGTNRGTAYRMDRWTGEVTFIAGERSYLVQTPEETQAEAEMRMTTEEPVGGGRYSRFLNMPDLSTDLTTD